MTALRRCANTRADVPTIARVSDTPHSDHIRVSRAARPSTSVGAILGSAMVLCSVMGGCNAFDGVQPGAATLLSFNAGPTPGQAAEMALNEYDPNQRYQGTVLIANAPWGGDPVYLQMYTDHLDDADPGVRAAAARALGRHGEPANAPAIAGVLDDKDDLVRLEAVRALQRLHDPSVVPALLMRIDATAEFEPEIRASAAHALGQYREYRVVVALISRLDDPALAVNHHTLEALRILTGQDFGLDRTRWLDWVEDTKDLFAAGRTYTYPGYERDKRWLEHLPFFPSPPTEPSAAPVGLPRGS